MKEWYIEENIIQLSLNDQLELALSFFEDDYAENKFPVYYSYRYTYMTNSTSIFYYQNLRFFFKEGLIYDWSVSDWLCKRVLRNMIIVNGMECTKALSEWNTAKDVWQARCSIVSFSNINKNNQYTSLILESNAILIQRGERFAKTTDGWLLREILKIDQGIVVHFFKEYGQHFSKECLENSIKYLKKKTETIERINN